MRYLDRAKIISSQRITYYGFEWLFHTTMASYLINNEKLLELSNLSIGSVYKNHQKPDIKFEYNRQEVLLELKTIERNQFSWCKKDIEKLINLDGYRYVAVCCYRKRKDLTPDLPNTRYINQFNINDDFRVVLLSL